MEKRVKIKKIASFLEKCSQLQNRDTLATKGNILKKGSHLEKWVTLEEMGNSWKH